MFPAGFNLFYELQSTNNHCVVCFFLYKQQQLHTYLWFLPVPAEHNKVIVNIVKWTLIHILSNDRSRNIRVQMLSFSHCRKLRDRLCSQTNQRSGVHRVRERRLVNEGCNESTMMHSSEPKPQPLFTHLRGKLKYETTRCN